MIESWECLGRWWTEDSEPIPGRLMFSPTDGINLELVGTLDPLRARRAKLGDHTVIWGRTVQGHGMSLFGSLEVESSLSGSGEKTSQYKSHWMVLGEHLPASDAVTFHELEVGMFNLEEWIGPSGIVHDTSTEPPYQSSIRYQQLPPLKFRIGSFEASAESNGLWNHSVMPPSAGVRVKSIVRFKTPNVQTLDKFLNGPVRSLQYFLQLATSSRVPMTSLIGTSKRFVQLLPNGESWPVPVPILFTQKKAVPLPDRKHPANMLFSAMGLGATLPSRMNSWQEGRDRYPATLDFHFSTGPLDSDVPLEFRFFSAFVACEAYHRATHSNEQLNPAEYKRRRELLLSSVKTDPEVFEWANEKILGNEPSARRRLQDLYDEQPEIIRTLVEDTFIRRAVATRNRGIVHAHNNNPDVFTGRELFRATSLLRLIIQGCLLREIGFSPEEIGSMVPKITDYRILTTS